MAESELAAQASAGRFTLKEAEDLLKSQMQMLRGYQEQLKAADVRILTSELKASKAVSLAQTFHLKAERLQEENASLRIQVEGLKVVNSQHIADLHAAELSQSEERALLRTQVAHLNKANQSHLAALHVAERSHAFERAIHPVPKVMVDAATCVEIVPRATVDASTWVDNVLGFNSTRWADLYDPEEDFFEYRTVQQVVGNVFRSRRFQGVSSYRVTQI